MTVVTCAKEGGGGCHVCRWYRAASMRTGEGLRLTRLVVVNHVALMENSSHVGQKKTREPNGQGPRPVRVGRQRLKLVQDGDQPDSCPHRGHDVHRSRRFGDGDQHVVKAVRRQGRVVCQQGFKSMARGKRETVDAVVLNALVAVNIQVNETWQPTRPNHAHQPRGVCGSEGTVAEI